MILDYFDELDLPYQKNKFDKFYEILVRANAETNLTRIIDRQDHDLKHIYDSILLLKALPEVFRARNIADIGCGGGIPGIPLFLAGVGEALFPIDKVGKKINYVQSFMDELDIPGKAFHGNARELARKPELSAQMDLVVSRAVTDSPLLIKLCKGFLAQDSMMVCYPQATRRRGKDTYARM